MNFSIEIIGVIAGILTTSGFVPQIYKILKTKSVDGVSLSMFLVLLVGTICWLIYGLLIESFAIILTNIFSSLLIAALVILRIIYKK
jgi:MtN3 and saliva related transmembrane protein